jgi:hypothetical protein
MIYIDDMEAFLSGIMDENVIHEDLTDKECYMYAREGTYASLPSALSIIRVKMNILI